MARQTKGHPWTVTTSVDPKLIERTRFDELAIFRLRRAFWRRYWSLPQPQRDSLLLCGTCPRFVCLVERLQETWAGANWDAWWKFLEYEELDIAEMCMGIYPIAPSVVRSFSALFGIKVDFLLLGSAPAVDRQGANIDIWPAPGPRKSHGS